MITALAGGVGAARFLAGLLDVVDPLTVTAIVNTGDDDTFHGLTVCPDLDSVTYRLAGADNPETGWGLVGETFTTMDALDRYGASTWFRLGDRDLATHLYRTERLRMGASLSEVTAEITAAWGLTLRVLPMSDDRVATRITAIGADGEHEYAMQEWFVRERSEPPVTRIEFSGAETARPAPGVLDAITNADTIIVCPSNPLISIGPILAVPGVRDALVAARDRVVAVSPLISGKTVKGPADRMLTALGHEASCVGVARMYADWCSTIVVDTADAQQIDAIEALGLRAVATDTLMRDARVAAALAQSTLAAVGS
jgi:LPPG:FO 2-phospho-L-lactate transferase